MPAPHHSVFYRPDIHCGRIVDAVATPSQNVALISNQSVKRRLRFSGHLARTDPKQDQHRVIGASLRPPGHCRRPCGRPRTSWLGAIDTGVQSVNIGIHSACRKASDRTLWRRIDISSTQQHSIMGHASEETESISQIKTYIASKAETHTGRIMGKKTSGQNNFT